MIPLAPPGAKVHAAYMSISNTSDVAKSLIGVSAEGYGHAHIHKTEIKDDIATMSAVELVEIAPGQTVVFEHGGLHVMLMQPEGKQSEGDHVALELQFSDGTTEAVTAMVMKLGHGDHGSHDAHHGHGSHGDHGS